MNSDRKEHSGDCSVDAGQDSGIKGPQKETPAEAGMKTEENKMSISVVYWSGTGNTQAMAEAVAEGIRESGRGGRGDGGIGSRRFGALSGEECVCPGLPVHGRGAAGGVRDGTFRGGAGTSGIRKRRSSSSDPTAGETESG